MRGRFDAYVYEWLPPLIGGADKAPVFDAGRMIPVRFTVRSSDGTRVRDDSVIVDLTDSDGHLATAPRTVSTTPAEGVLIKDGTYLASLSTRGLGPGNYVLRVRFDSIRLAGEFSLGISIRQ